MNTIDGAVDLIKKHKRHRAVLTPRVGQFMYHWMKGTTHLPYLPLKLHVEPTSVCNLRCPMCPQSLGLPDEQGYMELDLFRKIIDDCKDYVREINLFLRGESLIHPQLDEMIRICEGAGIVANLSTNAKILTADRAEMLLDAGLSKLTVSFDAGEKEMYEKMRHGAKFDRVLANVLEFLRLKQARGSDKPYVVMQMLVFYEPGMQPKIPREFRDQFAGLPVDEWDPMFAHGWAGMFDSSEEFTPRPSGPNYHPCNWLWKSMTIYWDGTVPACCADWTGSYVLGDVREESISDLWNNENMVRLRQLQVDGRYKEVGICSRCDALWQPDGKLWQVMSKVEDVITGGNAPGESVRVAMQNGANGNGKPKAKVRIRKNPPPS